MKQCLSVIQKMQKTVLLGYYLIWRNDITSQQAKLNDGSVDEVLEALIRHLLDKSQPLKLRDENDKNEEKKETPDPESEFSFEMLAESGINELDDLFHQCNAPMESCQRHQMLYEGSLSRFMLSCVELELVPDTGVDLGHCMSNMKDYVHKHMDRPLLATPDGNFVKVYYEYDKILYVVLLKQHRHFNNCLEKFHNEYVSVSKAVLLEGPSLHEQLLKLQNHISDETHRLKDGDTSTNPSQNVKDSDWINISEKNILRIDRSAKLMQATVEAAENAKITILSALSAA